MKIGWGLLLCVSLLLSRPLGAQTAAALSTDERRVIEGSNAFAVDLYKQLCTKAGNLFFSPVSISTALAMAYAGARGTTAIEMAKTCHFELEQERLHAAMGSLLRRMRDGQGTDEFYESNGLWLQKDFAFRDEFLKLTQHNYDATMEPVDFIHAKGEARAAINERVEKQTSGKIKDLLPSGAVSEDTRLILTNAIYFKGGWSLPFEQNKTKSEDFQITQTQKVRVPFMHIDGDNTHFKYLETDSFQALAMPYRDSRHAVSTPIVAATNTTVAVDEMAEPRDSDLSMIIFLPKSNEPLARFEESLTDANMTGWLAKLQGDYRVIFLSLPKFKATLEFDLGQALRRMGAPQMFSSTADFSGMTAEKNLAVSAIRHKAYVSVDEKGTEAAAGSAMTFSLNSTAPTPPPIHFRADHPFVFLIRDNRSGSILFLGRVSDPSTE
jgi:serine protease inhibitor